MKAFIIVVFVFLISFDSKAQCIGNEDFATYCGTTSGSCPSFSSSCAANWIRSHGSPQIFTDPNPINNVAYMWSYSDIGEGIFSAYNFQANNNYNIRIRVNASIAVNAGSFRLYATTGLTQPSVINCGDSYPTPSSSQLIVDNTDRNLGWQEYTYSFTPNSNYSQIWIYPNNSNANQYNLYVDYVRVCLDTCTGSVTYNQGTLPTGETKAGNIYIGSSYGGSGTVTVSSTAQTTMTAASTIIMKDEFIASVSGSGTFTARINPCSNPASRFGFNVLENRPNIDISKFPRVDEMRLEGTKQYSLYPNPASKKVYLQAKGIATELTTIILTDNNGKDVMKKTQLLKGGETIPIYIQGLKPGVYFVQIRSKNFNSTEKLIIQ